MNCPRCGEPLLSIERDEDVDEAKGYRLVTCVACGGWWKEKMVEEGKDDGRRNV